MCDKIREKKKITRVKDMLLSEEKKSSGMYQKARGDYCEIFVPHMRPGG